MNGLSISDIANGVNFEILHAWPHNVTFFEKKGKIYFEKSSSISLAHFHPRSLIANLYEFE